MKYTLFILMLITGCRELTPYERGRNTYISSCVPCHNSNPVYDGSIGPALKGIPFEVLSHKVMLGRYPFGYKPKRSTHIMSTFFLILKNQEVWDLWEYLK